MKNLISIIVTTRNEEEVLDNLLRSIFSQSYKFFEVILVDNFSIDKTIEIAKKYRVRIFSKGPERSVQRNFGSFKANGKFILILDADMVLTKHVLKSCMTEIKADHTLGGLVIPEKSFGEGYWAKCKAFERQFYLGDENIEAARFFKKTIFKKFKGYETKITGPEDWDLPLRMKKSGVKIGRISDYILHNERKFSPWKSAGKKFYYALHSKEYLKRHPEMILRQGNLFFRPQFYRNISKLFENPKLVLGFFLIRFLEMSGALLGITIAMLRK